MIGFERHRGDTYPLSATIRIDGSLFDLTNGSTVSFSYKSIDSGTVKTISGTIESNPDATAKEKATAIFYPVSGVDFTVAGRYEYDIQVINESSIVYTVSSGEFEILSDITI